MNKKIMAVLAALMMCAVAALAAAPLVSNDAADPPKTETAVSVVEGESKYVSLFVNTTAFPTGATVTIYTGNATNPATGYTLGTPTPVNDGSDVLYTYTITGDEATGIYEVEIAGNLAVKDSELYVKIMITYLGVDQSKEFKITVTVVAPVDSVVAKNNGTTVNADADGARAKWTAGSNVEPVTVVAKIGSSEVAAGDYFYYATGLPSGVAMKSDGVISGAIPSDVTVLGSYDITVYVTGKDTGFTEKFPVTIYCEPEVRATLVYTVTVDGKVYSNVTSTGDGKILINDGDTIGAVQGKVATITVNKDTTITVVDPAGNVLTTSITSSTDPIFQLGTSGTGQYVITMFDGSATYTFNLYVINGIVVVADIAVNCGSV